MDGKEELDLAEHPNHVGIGYAFPGYQKLLPLGRGSHDSIAL